MMVSSRFWFALCLPLSLALGNQASIEHNFNDATIGAAPPGFTFGSMRQREPGRWTVQKNDAETVLYHERDALIGYSLAISDVKTPPDLVVVGRLRFAEGVRAGGLVWRYVDDHHYYSLILDLSRSEVGLFRVSGGNRVRLESEDGLELDPQGWHTLKISHIGNNIRASIGGVRVFEQEDRNRGKAGGESRVGFIATGNSGVYFDDLKITPRSHP